ncbi:MAG: MYXO-CTERM sorting domain-containing protein [Pontixanthobacter sp.]
MRENLDQWAFVMASYGVGIAATLALVIWSWMAMRRAEARRDKAKQK